MPMPRSFFFSLVACFLALGWSGGAQGPVLDMPCRLWDAKPGPVQSAPDAPRLLVVYPDDPVNTIYGEAMRYAGRVDPPTAKVSLNGAPLKIWPGGVFTGLKPLAPGETATWRFVAEFDGQQTTVERVVERPEPAPPPASWPLEFYQQPHYPSGTYWLPAGKSIVASLYASPGHEAFYRFGERGDWQPMGYLKTDEKRGAIYQASLDPEGYETGGEQPRPYRVHFLLRATRDGEPSSRTLESTLYVGELPAERPLTGRVAINRATFFNDQSSWDNFGYLIEGTTMPVLEVRGDRLRTNFENGVEGWLDTAQVDLVWDEAYRPRRLAPPEVNPVKGNRLLLEWPEVMEPLSVLYARPKPERLRIELPGARSMNARDYNLHSARPFKTLESFDAQSGAPHLQIELEQPLWGYETRVKPHLQVEVRTPPQLVGASPEKPLTGLRILLDPGHGGGDFGAIGPSGLIEKDLNLFQAIALERELQAMGAVVQLIMDADEAVELDERVDAAIDWDPDLFLSLHHNSVGFTTEPTKDRGPQVYYHYEHSRPLAEAIARELGGTFGTMGSARTFQRNLRVNRNISLCPSVLIETAFVCHPEDEYLLRQTATHTRTATRIAEAVRKHLAALQE